MLALSRLEFAVMRLVRELNSLGNFRRAHQFLSFTFGEPAKNPIERATDLNSQ